MLNPTDMFMNHKLFIAKASSFFSQNVVNVLRIYKHEIDDIAKFKLSLALCR